jgi:hypothetical protein
MPAPDAIWRVHSGLRGRLLPCSAVELPRILIPRTSVNKGKRDQTNEPQKTERFQSESRASTYAAVSSKERALEILPSLSV